MRIHDRQLDGVVLGVRGVVKTFGRTRALDGVDLDVHRGEAMALLGANGAGKSTLVRVLSGALTPDEGEVVVDGDRIHLHGVHEARGKGIAFVPQELTVAPDHTVAENLLASGWPRRFGVVHGRKGNELAAQACEGVGLEADPWQLVADLSPAERRLLMIARGLLGDPRILILDEPTAALGEREAERLVATLQSLRRRELSLIYISHRMNEISRLCDSVTVLRNGRVVMRDRATPEVVARAVAVGMARADGHESPADRPAIAAASSPVDGTERRVSVRCRNLVTPVLNDVSIEVAHGEIVGVAGLLGSGRTELLRALAGADPVLSGVIEVDDAPQVFRSPHDAIAAGIALIPEDRRNEGGLLALSVQENLVHAAIPSRRGWLRPREERRLAHEAISTFGIRCQSPDQLLSTLSGGNQQKVIFARWLLTGARVLLLDEPTAGIDVVAKAELMELVTQAVAEGRSAVVVSSELDELVGFCDRIYVLRDGRVQQVVDGATSVAELAHLCGSNGREHARA